MFSGPGHTPQCRVEGKEGLPGELRLAWTHRIWGEECVFAQKDKFAKGLGVSAIFCVIFGNLRSGCELFDSSRIQGCSKISKVSRPSYINLRFEI